MNIKQLARKLDLSITTVSRALGGYSDVSDKTRERVKKYANKYEYRPNPYASVLASGKSNTVGYVLPVYGTNSSTLNQGNFLQRLSDGLEESKNKIITKLPVGFSVIANNYFWLHGRKPFKENKELSRELLRIRGSFFVN